MIPLTRQLLTATLESVIIKMEGDSLELFNYSTPEKAFKTSVRPLSYLLIIQAISLFYLFITWPSTEFVNFPIPFIPDVFKYSFLIATAILILIIGIGLYIVTKPAFKKTF